MQITKSRLKQLIREELGLITEAAKSPQDLPDDIGIAVGSDPDLEPGTLIYVYYARADHGPAEAGKQPAEAANPRGSIDITRTGRGDTGPCSGAWKISMSQAQTGWGPMLYDVAMEYATLNGGGLIADRDSVSHKARAVWDYYLNDRNDVLVHQLDDLDNTLTPEEEDNCAQYKLKHPALGIALSEPLDWVDGEAASLSKLYTKEPTTMAMLKSMDKLFEL